MTRRPDRWQRRVSPRARRFPGPPQTPAEARLANRIDEAEQACFEHEAHEPRVAVFCISSRDRRGPRVSYPTDPELRRLRRHLSSIERKVRDRIKELDGENAPARARDRTKRERLAAKLSALNKRLVAMQDAREAKVRAAEKTR